MARRCSHCNHDGHNSRTCPTRGVRIFGVRLTDGSLQKSASTGNLAIFARSAAAGESPAVDPLDSPATDACGPGYASDGFNAGPASHERKKGVPWTEHEHKMFLLGLKKLGKGDWRGISRSFVISRTPTQVASHAQKYFIRHSANNRRKRRLSLFDVVADEASTENLPSSSHELELQDAALQQLFLTSEGQAGMRNSGMDMAMNYAYPPPIYPVFFPMHQVSDEHADVKDDSAAEVEGAILELPPNMQFGFFLPGFPCPLPCWPSRSHEIVKPTAVHSKSPIKIDELLGMSSLSLGACNGEAGPFVLRPSFVGGSRHSAFHSGASSGVSRLVSSTSTSSSSPIHAT